MQKSKYNSLSEWRLVDNTAYVYACRLGFLDKICVQNGWPKQKSNGYWTKEKCVEDALQYKTRTEWQKKSSTAFSKSKHNNWHDECCAHMEVKMKPHGYWTKEKCIEEAKRYKTKKEWQENSEASYTRAHKNKWIDECCEHMLSPKKLTLEDCKNNALNYIKKHDWMNNSRAFYSKASREGWIDLCCQHMTNKEVKDPGYWTKERCVEEAKRYKTKIEWYKNSQSSYAIAGKRKWMHYCTGHMIETKKINGYWTKERCIEDALKYKTIKDWMNNSFTSYSKSCRNKWILECTSHMNIKKTSFTKEECENESIKFKTKSAWEKAGGVSGSMFRFSKKHKWLNLFFK